MASSKMEQHIVQLKPGQFALLEEKARNLGLFQTRGPGKGTTGSVSQLLQALADLIEAGDLELAADHQGAVSVFDRNS